jgi:hypothetical protein
MKKVFLLGAMLLGMASYSQSGPNSQSTASTVVAKKVVEYNATTKTYNLDSGTGRGGDKTPPTPAGKSAIYHGETYPVYVSARGKEFILVTSKKSGKQYRKYIN